MEDTFRPGSNPLSNYLPKCNASFDVLRFCTLLSPNFRQTKHGCPILADLFSDRSRAVTLSRDFVCLSNYWWEYKRDLFYWIKFKQVFVETFHVNSSIGMMNILLSTRFKKLFIHNNPVFNVMLQTESVIKLGEWMNTFEDVPFLKDS